MKRMAILPVLCALALCATGCDFLRTVAGRPTSAQLTETSSSSSTGTCASCADCPKCVGACCDSTAVLSDTLSQQSEPEVVEEVYGEKSLYMLKLSKDSIKQIVSGLPYTYYVLVGTFTSESYADAQARRARNAGFEVVTIPFSDGRRTAVAISPTNDLDFALSELARVRQFAFCPADAYIMLAE